MEDGDKLKGPDFSGFDSFDSKGNPTLEKAANTLKKLGKVIIDNNGPLNEPIIVGLHGKSGVGKSHLIAAFETSIMRVPGIKVFRPDRRYGFSQNQQAYRSANVIVSDDLFQAFQSINDVFVVNSFLNRINDPEVRHIPEFIFDIYDGKKLWVVSSNFDIKEVLKRIGNMDQQERLKSRIDHLLATTGVLHLEGEDHRKVLATMGTRFTSLFN